MRRTCRAAQMQALSWGAHGSALQRASRPMPPARQQTQNGTAAVPAAQQVRIETQKGVAFGQDNQGGRLG